MAGRSRDFCNQTEVDNEQGRRSFLFRLGQGLGSVALSSLLHQEAFHAGGAPENPLAPRPPHFPVKAKSCIFLFMAGGPSQMDTFDPKPLLTKFHGTACAKGSQPRASSNLLYVGSPFSFARHGQCGMEVSEIFPHLATCVDDIAVVRSLQTDSDAHSTGAFLMNTAQPIPGSPCLGSWVTYGFKNQNQNLPAYVVLPIRSVLYGHPELVERVFAGDLSRDSIEYGRYSYCRFATP